MASLFGGKEHARRRLGGPLGGAGAPPARSSNPIAAAPHAYPFRNPGPDFMDDTKLLKRFRPAAPHGSFPPQQARRAGLLQAVPGETGRGGSGMGKASPAGADVAPGREALPCRAAVHAAGAHALVLALRPLLPPCCPGVQGGTWKKDKLVSLLDSQDSADLLDQDGVGPSAVEEYEPEQPTTTG